MGIETTITCDLCTRVIPSDVEDYATIERKFEIDHNREDKTDERDRKFLVCCQSCGHALWRGFDARVEIVRRKWKGPKGQVGQWLEDKSSGSLVGTVDEYGSVWDGEPGASELIGDLVLNADQETSRLYLLSSVER